MSHPIPKDALDDRLAFVGGSGSGKTYAAGTAVERLLSDGARVVIIDPLGVWYGLRLAADGAGEGFPVVIFGGAHGDVALNDGAGALIGEACATMAESAIIDLSDIGAAAGERRFVQAFLSALYRHTAGAPLHLVLDEADMWAPQNILDKDGGAPKLLAITERIVRRGRVKGFIPWLITQRPASINKSVLSQAEGLVALQLTGKNERDALGAWVDGAANPEDLKALKQALPGFARGEAQIWIPARGVMTRAQFPRKRTFDSSATPKRGETRAETVLRPLDVGALKTRLATVEEDARANDPAALKSEIAKLRRDLAAAQGRTPAPDAATVAAAEDRGRRQAAAAMKQALLALAAGQRERLEAVTALLFAEIEAFACNGASSEGAASGPIESQTSASLPDRTRALAAAARQIAPPAAGRRTRQARKNIPQNIPAAPAGTQPGGARSAPQLKVLSALAWWRLMGHLEPTKAQVAAIVGWAVKGSNLRCRLGELSTAGLIAYPRPGVVALTDDGVREAPAPDVEGDLFDHVRAMLTNPQTAVFDALLACNGEASKAELGAALGWEPGGSNLRCRLGELSARELIRYPAPGRVALQDWVRG